MTGVDLILAALSTGAAAAVSTATNRAVTDAYASLKGLLSRRLVNRGSDAGTLDADSGAADGRLGEALAACGADSDEDVLIAARRLLNSAGVDVENLRSQVRMDTNFGAVGTFNAPVQITNHAPGRDAHDPPAGPGRV